MKQSLQIGFSVSENEKQLIIETAKKNHMTVSGFVRSIVLTVIEEQSSKEKE